MESKLNYSAIETYVKAYSTKLADELYDGMTTVSGDRLLQMPIKQVGLFILQQIQTAWSEEANKLKSPYFDYESEAVQSGIKKLMNTLSKNIALERPDLEPLLDKAVHDTLLLIISPYAYFKNLSTRTDITDSENSRFIILNSSLNNEIVKRLDANAETSLHDQLEHLFTSLDSTPDDPKEILDLFSALHPIKEDDFYMTKKGADEDDDLEESSSSENTLNDRFIRNSYETVADELKQNNSGNTSLKSMLSINQKFMFINDLFNDNQDDFNKVIDFLESCESKETATSFINNNYLKHNIWNPNAPQVKEFLELINKKFV